MISAGIAASDYLNMKPTIEANGILMSITDTFSGAEETSVVVVTGVCAAQFSTTDN